MPDLDKMTDQELIDYFKQRGQKNKTIKRLQIRKIAKIYYLTLKMKI